MDKYGRFFIEKNHAYKSCGGKFEDISEMLPYYLNSNFSILANTTVRNFFELLKPIKCLLSTIFRIYNFDEYYNYGLNNKICIREMETGTLPWEYMSIKYIIKHKKSKNKPKKNKYTENTSLSMRVEGVSVQCKKEHLKNMNSSLIYSPKIGERDGIFLWGLNLPLYMDMNIKTENFIYVMNMGSDKPYIKLKNTNGIKFFDIIGGIFSQLSYYGSIDETIAYLNYVGNLTKEYEKQENNI